MVPPSPKLCPTCSVKHSPSLQLLCLNFPPQGPSSLRGKLNVFSTRVLQVSLASQACDTQLWAAHSPREGHSEGTSNSVPGEELLSFPTLLLTAFQTWLTLPSTQPILSGVTFPVTKWKMFRERKDKGEGEVSSLACDVSPPSDSPVSASIQHTRAFAWGLSVEDFVLWEWEVIYSWEKWQPTGHAIQYFENAPLTASTTAPWAWICPQQHRLHRLHLPEWPWTVDAFGLLYRWMCK